MVVEHLFHLAASWLITYLIHSTLLLGCIAALAPLLNRRERLVEALWRIGLLGGIVTASAQCWKLGLVHPSAFEWSFSGSSESTVPPVQAFVATLLSHLGTPLLATGVIAFLFIALARLLQLVIGRRALRRVLRRRVGIQQHSLGHRLKDKALGAVRVTVSSHIATPMVLGVGELCLPERALLEFTEEELDSVLAHEITHLARHDPAWLLLTSVIERVFFLQPLNALASARLRALAEFLCDESALRKTGSRVALASALASVAEWVTASPRVAAVGMASQGSLTVQRVRRILDQDTTAVEKWPAALGLLGMASPLAWLAIFGPAVAIPLDQPGPPSVPYIISAVDDAGSFAVTVSHGKVLGIVVDGSPLPREAVVQEGSRVHIRPASGGIPFDLTLTPQGGLRWVSRVPGLSSSHP